MLTKLLFDYLIVLICFEVGYNAGSRQAGLNIAKRLEKILAGEY